MNLQKPIMLFYFFFIATQKMPIQVKFSFKNDFTLVLCNKINEFLTWTKRPVRHSTSLHFFTVTKK